MAIESKFHVLAVDDSIVDRKLIERLLKTSSYQVTTVESGSKALEYLGFSEDDQACVSPNSKQEVRVNMIITDYSMPGMTGYDLLKKIKKSSHLRNIPVVIMSSEDIPTRINRCLEEGAEEFFLKPVRFSDVEKLKPHIIKTENKNYPKKLYQENQQALEKIEFLHDQENILCSKSNSTKRKILQKSFSPQSRYSGLAVV